MANRKVEAQIEELKALRTTGDTDAVAAALRKALLSKVSIIVAKAAAITGELRMQRLVPELAAAFDRMLQKPIQMDPQCWAKNAIAKALCTLEYTEAALFVRGLRHVQMEPVWAGEEDTAVTLRGICALALPSTGDLPRREVLRHLASALTDSYESSLPEVIERSAPVRVEAARAVAQMNGEEAALLLRLKARAGDIAPSVTGQVFDCLLELEGEEVIPFLSEFLRSGKDVMQEEAALSLGTSRLPAAVDLLQRTWETTVNPQLRGAILRGLSASRQESAFVFLLDLISKGRERDAIEAMGALTLLREQKDFRERVAAAVDSRDEPAVRKAFQTGFGSHPQA